MSYETKNIRNICFMGHGNSGKTSLAESMLPADFHKTSGYFR